MNYLIKEILDFARTCNRRSDFWKKYNAQLTKDILIEVNKILDKRFAKRGQWLAQLQNGKYCMDDLMELYPDLNPRSIRSVLNHKSEVKKEYINGKVYYIWKKKYVKETTRTPPLWSAKLKKGKRYTVKDLKELSGTYVSKIHNYMRRNAAKVIREEGKFIVYEW